MGDASERVGIGRRVADQDVEDDAAGERVERGAAVDRRVDLTALDGPGPQLLAVACRGMDGPVLLTGAAGLLGHWLVRTRPADRQLVALVHRRPVPGLPTVVADLRDPVATAAAVRRIRPSLVLHAAYAKDAASIVAASRHVALAAAEHGAAVLLVSSDAVFPGDGAGRDESAEPEPTWDYGRWKARAEEAVAAADPAATIVRLPLVVSIDPDDHAVARIRSGAAHREPTAWFVDELRQPAGARELAQAIWSIAALDRAERAGTWHLAGAETLSRFEIAQRVVAALGLDAGAIVPATAPPGRPRRLHLLDDRARRRIGWSPTPILR